MYAKLKRFKEQMLENYQGSQLEYSTSDYHHAQRQPIRMCSTRASVRRLEAGHRHPSQFSLLQPGMRPSKKNQSHSVRRRTSVAETEGTDESYDPFRPSKRNIGQIQADHARITVLRGASQASSRNPSGRAYSKASLRNPILARAKEEDGYSISTTPPAMRGSRHQVFERMTSNQRRISRGNSRVTVNSKHSVNSNSSIIIARKSTSYKRNVSFVHNRPRASSGHQPRLRTKEHRASPFTLHQKYLQDQVQPARDIATDPSIPSSSPLTPAVVKGKASQYEPLLITRRRRSPTRATHSQPPNPDRTLSQYVSHDARKVSTELAQLCDDSWNRDSITTLPSASTPATDPRISQQSYVSPATSFSIDDGVKGPLPSSKSEYATKATAPTYENRPLSPSPSNRPAEPECLGTYTKSEIAKTRNLLKERARDSCMAPGYLDEVIAHLDRLMQPSQIRLANEERRALSTPDPSTGIPRKDTFEQIMEKNNIGYRAASEPTKRQKVGHQPSTIRLVEEEEYKALSPIQPLTIRKKSSSSGPSSGSQTPTQQTFPPQTSQTLPPQATQRSAGLALLDNQGLDPIDEDEDKENFDPASRNRNTYPAGEKKKRNWFRRHQRAQPSRDTDIAPPPMLGKKQRPFSDCQDLESKNRLHAVNEPISKDAKKPPVSGKGRFLKIFKGEKDSKNSKKSLAEGGGDYDLDDTASQSTEASSSTRQYTQHNASKTPVLKRKGRKQPQGALSNDNDLNSPPAHRTIDPQPQNWLARFFRIKPATRVLCFQVSKVRARKEITTIFRDWRKYGMRDIHVDKTTSRVWASVGAKNSLNIPAMKLAAEVHTVLFRGRRANLSVARFVQKRGAKSSFERAMGALEEVLVERGMLVEDAKVVGEMRRGVGL